MGVERGAGPTRTDPSLTQTEQPLLCEPQWGGGMSHCRGGPVSARNRLLGGQHRIRTTVSVLPPSYITHSPCRSRNGLQQRPVSTYAILAHHPQLRLFVKADREFRAGQANERRTTMPPLRVHDSQLFHRIPLK